MSRFGGADASLRPMMTRLPLLFALGLVGCQPETSDVLGDTGDTGRAPCAEVDPERRPLWGDLHVHTARSMDAATQDGRVSPREAYAFARGDAVRLPPLDADGVGTRELRIDRPLDFVGLTDHAEYLGETRICSTPGLAGYDAPICETIRAGGQIGTAAIGNENSSPDPVRNSDICGDDGRGCAEAAQTVWAEIQDEAERAYDRTEACSFTTLVGYEYTSIPGLSVLHRNVFFRGREVPDAPISHFEAPNLPAFWRALKARCVDAGTGCDVLAIPHNSNQSNGRAFLPDDGDLDVARENAALRASLEPLVEIYQHKGDSECAFGLAAFLGTTDEACAFEKLDRPSWKDCGDTFGGNGQLGQGCASPRDYVRHALGVGLAEERRLGVNPWRLGVIGSTDTHNGTPGAVSEADFVGHVGNEDATPEMLLRVASLADGGVENSPGGLVAVWAEENTRPAVFDALRRREAWGTSGPRIVVRVFAGWDLPDLCGRDDAVAVGDAQGVPMGGVLSDPPEGAAFRLYVRADADPGTTERPGGLLQRIQIVKGWLDGDEVREQVVDVAGGPNGATVDVGTCTPSGEGETSLCATWEDPDFDPEVPAFYYARVLEDPSCRWSQHACNRLAMDDRPMACFDPDWTQPIQERAWSSPVWVAP